MLLEGYGSYGVNVLFSSNDISLLDRGLIVATAHVRGGGELGKPWHDGGRMMTKMNTFTDFIAVSEFLITHGYTSSDRLVITGGSAGGLLMGAVTNMRPDLFRAVVTYVPFVDVMNTMLDASLPLTTGEYLEWGNPNEKAAYDYMVTYSPYDNIAARAYPAILVRSSLNDSQVPYWEPSKYVARMRVLKTDSNPLLFKIKLQPGGHGRLRSLRPAARRGIRLRVHPHGIAPAAPGAVDASRANQGEDLLRRLDPVVRPRRLQLHTPKRSPEHRRRLHARRAPGMHVMHAVPEEQGALRASAEELERHLHRLGMRLGIHHVIDADQRPRGTG